MWADVDIMSGGLTEIGPNFDIIIITFFTKAETGENITIKIFTEKSTG